MPREQGQGQGESVERQDTSPLTDAQRIETEKPQRDAARRAWDATHDPSPEFEKSARPLGPDYGSHRPKHLDLSPEQVTEIEEFTGRPIDEVLATRDQDPRAGHNRDEAGNILDADGHPREFVDPRIAGQNEQDRPTHDAPGNQPTDDAERAGPQTEDSARADDTEGRDNAQFTGETGERSNDGRTESDPSTDLKAPSDSTGKGRGELDNEGGSGDGDGADSGNSGGGGNNGPDVAGAADDGSDDANNKDRETAELGRFGPESGQPAEPDRPDDPDQSDEPDNPILADNRTTEAKQSANENIELELPGDLSELVGQIATDLRDGKVTRDEAADRLESFRDQFDPEPTESTTETIRTENTAEGVRHHQRGTAEATEDTPGERTANDESNQVSDRERKRNTLVEGTSNLLEDVDSIASKAEKGLPPRLPPGSHGETTTRQPDVPTFENPRSEELDAGNIISGMLATSVAAIVIWQKMNERSR